MCISWSEVEAAEKKRAEQEKKAEVNRKRREAYAEKKRTAAAELLLTQSAKQKTGRRDKRAVPAKQPTVSPFTQVMRKLAAKQN